MSTDPPWPSTQWCSGLPFNYLVGNLDAHAKNIAFLMRGQKAEVGPFYDMLCVEAYLPRATMSMAIAGENKPGWVEGLHWDAMAFEARVAPRLVRSVLKKLVERIPDGISRVIGNARLMPSERAFVRERILPVIEERCSFAGGHQRPAVLVARRSGKSRTGSGSR